LSVSITGCPAPSPLLSVNCLKPGAIFLSFFGSCLGLISSCQGFWCFSRVFLRFWFGHFLGFIFRGN
jgi:hypothetical protein